MSDFLAEMEARRARAEAPRAPVASVIIGFIAAFVAVLFQLSISVPAAMRMAVGAGSVLMWLATVLGLALVTTGVIGAILWFAFIRPSRPRWIMPVLAGLLVITTVFGLGFSRGIGEGLEARRQEEIAIAELNSVVDMIASGDIKTLRIDTRPKAKGEAGEIEQVVKTSLADVLQVARKYDAEVTALNLDGLSAQPATRTRLKEQARRFEQARSLTKAYRTDVLASLRAIPDRVEAARIDDSAKKSFMRGYNRAIANGTGDLDRQLDLTEKLIDLNLEQIRWLLARPNVWQQQGDRIAFYEQSDLNTFNRQVQAIEAVGSELTGMEEAKRIALRRQRFGPEAGT